MQTKFSKKFEQLIDFVKFNQEFRNIVRYEGTKLGKKVETDPEHSYQVIMVAWFLIENNNLKLNRELCLMYAMVHDLVEIYAGDTFSFDKNKVPSQRKREGEALKKIEKRFPAFKNLIKIIKKYEEKKDKESKFIHAIDKILPPIQIYLDNGKMWRQKKVSLEDVLKSKNKKIALSPEIDKYWQELVKEFTKNKKKFFQ